MRAGTVMLIAIHKEVKKNINSWEEIICVYVPSDNVEKLIKEQFEDKLSIL